VFVNESENSERRRENKREEGVSQPCWKEKQGKSKRIHLDDELKFLIEFHSESDDDKNEEAYVTTSGGKRTNHHKTPKRVMSSTTVSFVYHYKIKYIKNIIVYQNNLSIIYFIFIHI